MSTVGIIVGVTVGIVALVGFVVLVVLCCFRCHRKSQVKKFAMEARVLGIRTAVPLDHLDETQQRAIVVSQLNRTLPADVTLAEAIFTAAQSRNASFTGLAAGADGGGPMTEALHASPTENGSGAESAGTGAYHSFAGPPLDSAARMRQPHILELEILLPHPHQIPVLDAPSHTIANTSTTSVTVAAESQHAQEVHARDSGQDSAAPPTLPSQIPSRRPSQLARLIPFLGYGSRHSDGTEETGETIPSSLGTSPPQALPYSPTLIEPQQRLWGRYLTKKAVVGEMVAAEASPPQTPIYYGVHAVSYQPRPNQPSVPVHAHRGSPSSTEPVTPAKADTPAFSVISS